MNERKRRDTVATHYGRLTGAQALQRLRADAVHEEYVSLWLVARAVGCSSKRLRRDWNERGLPIPTRVGHEDRVVARIALQTYFPHAGEQENKFPA